MGSLSPPSPHSTPRQLTFSIQLLQYPLSPITVVALVDCGASGNFVDPSLLANHNLITQPHPQPIPVELIDGSPPAPGPITCYYDAKVRCPGDHTETLHLDVTRLAHYSVVLGFPWLHKHNPAIDW